MNDLGTELKHLSDDMLMCRKNNKGIETLLTKYPKEEDQSNIKNMALDDLDKILNKIEQIKSYISHL